MGCFDALTSLSQTPSAAAAAIVQGGDGVPPTTTGAESWNSTPRSSAQASSPTLDLTREYTIAVHTSSYNEIWSRIHDQSESLGQVQVLNPDRDSIEQALHLARPNKLTRLVSDYFDSSEQTSHLCLQLQRSIDRARSLYRPICDLIDHLPSSSSSSSFTQSQFDWAFDNLTQFHSHDNPFPSDTNFDHMRHSFSQLKQQLDLRLGKARSRARLARRSTSCSAICLIGTALGVTISAVVIATHALAALVAAPFLTLIMPTHFTKQQLHHISQLQAAAKGTYVLHNDLYTIDRLVARLHATVESDKDLVRYVLDCGGRDKYPILEVVKQLRKNHPNFLHQLKDLEEHVCLCFTTVNRARTLLLQEIHLHQTSNSQ